MKTIHLPAINKVNFFQEHDPDARVAGIFPFSAATGNKSTATVYFELEPGKKVPAHTDSAEEVLLILAGQVEVTIGTERKTAREGTLAVVPAMEPHAVLNTGRETARVVGFFSSNTVMSTFVEPLIPADVPPPPQSVRTLVNPFPAALEEEILQ